MNVAAAASLADRARATWSGSTRCSTAVRPSGAAAAALVSHATDEWRLAFVAPRRRACWSRRSPAGSAACRRRRRASTTACCTRSGSCAARAWWAWRSCSPCSAMVEGGIDTWGVLVLRDQLGVSLAAGAAAYVLGQARGHRVACRSSARSPVASAPPAASRVGSGVAAVGLVLVGRGAGGGRRRRPRARRHRRLGVLADAARLRVAGPGAPGRHRERRHRHRLHRVRDRPGGDRHRRRGGRACGPRCSCSRWSPPASPSPPAHASPRTARAELSRGSGTARRCGTRHRA